MNRLCEDYVCRCARAAELLAIFDRNADPRTLLAAIEVHDQKVECRLEVAIKSIPKEPS